jgi:hypothetical protein
VGLAQHGFNGVLRSFCCRMYFILSYQCGDEHEKPYNTTCSTGPEICAGTWLILFFGLL